MWVFLAKILLVLSIAYIIGTERAREGKVIGFRSTAILIFGAFMYTTLALRVGGDVTRIIGQIMTGIGFLGAGVIFKSDQKDIHNITTSILIWVLPVIGMLIGLSCIFEAIVGALVLLLLLIYRPSSHVDNSSEGEIHSPSN